jgi:hypothetical protein
MATLYNKHSLEGGIDCKRHHQKTSLEAQKWMGSFSYRGWVKECILTNLYIAFLEDSRNVQKNNRFEYERKE